MAQVAGHHFVAGDRAVGLPRLERGGDLSAGLAEKLCDLAGDLRRASAGREDLEEEDEEPRVVLDQVEQVRDEDVEDVEVIDLLASERRVAVYCRVTAQRGDRTLDNTTIHLLHVDETERIDEIWLHNFDDVAVNDFWS